MQCAPNNNLPLFFGAAKIWDNLDLGFDVFRVIKIR